jgi:hypothetical protein
MRRNDSFVAKPLRMTAPRKTLYRTSPQAREVIWRESLELRVSPSSHPRRDRGRIFLTPAE